MYDQRAQLLLPLPFFQGGIHQPVILAHVMGSLLHYTCWFDRPGGHQKVELAKKLNILFTEVQKEYTEHKVGRRLTNLTLNMFCNPKQPHATHPMLHCKGAECKHLVKPLLAVLRKMLGKGRHIHNNMLSCLQSINDLIDLWDRCGMFLSSSEWKNCTRTLSWSTSFWVSGVHLLLTRNGMDWEAVGYILDAVGRKPADDFV